MSDSGKSETESESGGPMEVEFDEQVWASAGGCGPAIDSAQAWTRMGDTCCGDEGTFTEIPSEAKQAAEKLVASVVSLKFGEV